MFLIRFIGAAVISSLTLVGGSIIWPKLTSQPRPELVEKVYDSVKETTLGVQVEALLGDTDQASLSGSVASVAGTVANQVAQDVQKKSQEFITEKVVEEVLKRFETLPEKQQEQVRQSVCPAQ